MPSAFALFLAVAATASASTKEASTPSTNPPNTPIPMPAPAAPAVPAAPAAMPPPPPPPPIPLRKRAPSPTVGLGIGITAPSDHLAPDSASARIRLADKWAIEPLIKLASFATTVDTTYTPDDHTLTTVDSTMDTGVGVSVRYAALGDGTVDGIILGGLGFASTESTNDPGGDDNAVTSKVRSTSVSVGVGLEHWIGPHWTVSFDAVAVNYATTGLHGTTEGPGGNSSTDNGQGFTMSLATQPTVRASLHLYL